jgi:hypothetical protein
MFGCESDGYEAIVFGAFDGVTSWTNNAFINLGPLHQEVVSAHEERHLRLQKGTPWGSLLMLLMLSERAEAVSALADACRRTHEAYATYLSVGHVASGLRALEGNALYLDYWRSAAALAEVFDADAPRLTILEYLFHLLMAPAPLAEAGIDGPHTELLAHAPDLRLATLTALLKESPHVATTIGETVAAAAEVDRTQDLVAQVIDNGLPTLSTAEQLTHATRLMAEFNETSETHRVQAADRSRATSLTDQLDYQQFEVIRAHREPTRLEIGAPPMFEGAPHPLTDFVRDDPQLGPHVWGVLLAADVLARQFVPDQEPEDDRYWGPLAVDRRDEPPVTRLWPLSDPPATVTETFTEAGIATLLMTTMSTLSDPSTHIPFSPGAPVFVLVDLPTLPFCVASRTSRRRSLGPGDH